MTKRLYATQDFCPIARTMNVVGDRWTMLILRDLSWGRKRFAELEASLIAIGPTLLSDRLKSLVANGMVERITYNEHPPRALYKLTEKGKGFIPVLLALREYGNTWESCSDLAGPISASLRVPPMGSPPTGEPDWEPDDETSP